MMVHLLVPILLVTSNLHTTFSHPLYEAAHEDMHDTYHMDVNNMNRIETEEQCKVGI